MTIKQIQCLLVYLGYDTGGIDGVSGQLTREAIKKFQSSEGLSSDGIAGEQTQKRLKDAVYQNRLNASTNNSNNKGISDFWKNIKYFKHSDPYIGCSCGRCGGFPVEPAEKLMLLADRVRIAAGLPMVPTSTVRCKQHNAEVNGVYNSRHLLGHAMDFQIPGMTSDKILSIVKAQKDVVYCYAIDSVTVHMDIGN